MEFLPWSCTRIVFVQFWPSHVWLHHCAALGIRSDDLLGSQGTKVSRGAKNVEGSGLPAIRHAHLQRRASAQKKQQDHEGRTHRVNVSPQTPSIKRCSSCIIFAVQPTRNGGNGQACCMSSLKETSNVVKDAGQAWRSTDEGFGRDCLDAATTSHRGARSRLARVTSTCKTHDPHWNTHQETERGSAPLRYQLQFTSILRVLLKEDPLLKADIQKRSPFSSLGNLRMSAHQVRSKQTRKQKGEPLLF